MESKEIKYENMKDLNYGDLIIIGDPLMGDNVPYAFMSSIDKKSFHFTSGYGASLMVDCQDTIDGFKVRLIDDSHPSWNPKHSEHGKDIGEMLGRLTETWLTD